MHHLVIINDVPQIKGHVEASFINKLFGAVTTEVSDKEVALCKNTLKFYPYQVYEYTCHKHYLRY